MTTPHETTVQDRHRELGNKIIAHFVEEGHGYQPETVYEIIAQHEAKEIRELRDDCDDWRTEANTSNDYIRLLGTLLGCDDGDDIPEVRIEAMKDQIRLLTSERDRLKDGFLFCLGECDGKFWKEHSEEVKSAWEVAQALTAKHDGGGK